MSTAVHLHSSLTSHTTDHVRLFLNVHVHLHENALELVDRFPTGTSFTPISKDGDVLKALAETPEGVDTVERIARAS